MAAIATEVTYDVSPNLCGKILKFKFTAASTGDWIVFDVPIGACYLSDLTGAQATAVYATGLIHTGGISDSATTMIYDTVTAAGELPSTNGYIMVANEIMQYTAGGAATTGTFTGLKRGCFGTTPAAALEDATFYILNTLIVTTAAAGLTRGIADVIEE